MNERVIIPTLYPERPGSNVTSYLEIFSGDSTVELADTEKEAAMTIERMLSVSLDLNREKVLGGESYRMHQTEDEGVVGIEHAWRIPVNSVDFFMEYFYTDKGYADLVENMGYTGKKSRDAIEKFLSGISYVDKESDENSQKINTVSRNSRQHALTIMVDAYEAVNFDDIASVANPTKIIVVKNPEELITKVDQFAKLKRYLKKFSTQFDSQEPFSQAVSVIVNIHKRKLNELLAQQYPTLVSFIEQSAIADTQELHELVQQLREILQDHRFEMLQHIAYARVDSRDSAIQKRDAGDRLFERLDKFINGVGVRHEDEVEYSVISDKAQKLADEIEQYDQEKRDNNAEFTPEEVAKLKEIDIDGDTQKRWFELFLREHDLLSEEDSSTYNSDREGTARDGKWQVVMISKSEALAVDGKQQVVKIPHNFKRSVTSITPAGAIPGLDHEGAHVYQHENKKKVGLSIMNNVGMDRADVYAESGAVAWETATQEKLFGQVRPTNVHYLRAIEARYEGGTLRECAKAFFDSYMKYNPGASKKVAMRTAIDRAMRIFRNGGVYSDETHHVSNSEPLVYLEQELVVRELKKYGLEKILFIGRSNLEMLAQLHQVGLLDLSRIHAPRKKPSETILPELKKMLRQM